jgi:thiol-disulfide isomerase/thioredoxin
MRIGWLLIAACTTLACSGGAGAAGKSAPKVEVADLARIDAVLAQHRGHGVVLNFWATWCAPCVDELPELIEASHAFREQGGDLVLVSYDMLKGLERAAVVRKVEQFAERRAIDAQILIYDKYSFDEVNAHFVNERRNLKMHGGVPQTLAFDRAGELVDVQDGEGDKARFEEMFRTAIAK